MNPNDVVPEVLWKPTPERASRAAITDFAAFVGERTGRDLTDYAALWDYSTTDLTGFWSAIADYFGIQWHDRPGDVLPAAVMPGADWFPGGTLNYAEHALAGMGRGPADDPAVIAVAEDGTEQLLSLRELTAAVGAAQAGLRRLGVGAGDRVVALVPNAVHALVGFLATAALGAVWSSCSPDFGAPSVIDRFTQISPDGVDRGRRLPLRGARVPGRRNGAEDPGGTPVTGRRRAHRRPRHRCPGRHDRLGRADIGCDRTRIHARTVLRTALGAVLVGNHRSAQANRPVGGRHPAGTPEIPSPALGSRSGRSVPVVHHHRLDDVELPDRRPSRRVDRHPLRRQPRPSRPDVVVAVGRTAPGDAVRDVRALRRGLREGRSAAVSRTRPDGDRRDRIDRITVVHQWFPLDSRSGRWRHPDRLLLRRHRHLHRHRRRRTDRSGVDG